MRTRGAPHVGGVPRASGVPAAFERAQLASTRAFAARSAVRRHSPTVSPAPLRPYRPTSSDRAGHRRTRRTRRRVQCARGRSVLRALLPPPRTEWCRPRAAGSPAQHVEGRAPPRAAGRARAARHGRACGGVGMRTEEPPRRAQPARCHGICLIAEPRRIAPPTHARAAAAMAAHDLAGGIRRHLSATQPRCHRGHARAKEPLAARSAGRAAVEPRCGRSTPRRPRPSSSSISRPVIGPPPAVYSTVAASSENSTSAPA